LFSFLALTTAGLTVGLIVFGAIVRVTDSGLGCGSSWPLCDGTVLPPLDNITAWIEWLHRLIAIVIGLFGLGTLAVAIRAYRARNRQILWITTLAAIIFTFQAVLGGFVVMFDLPPTMVTLHLGTAMLLLGTLLWAGVASFYRPKAFHVRDGVSALVYINTVFALVIIMTGALVRGSGATLACTDWPLCNNIVSPLGLGIGQLALVHMLHRYAVLALGITLAMMIWLILKQRNASLLRWTAILSGLMYLGQAGVGAMFVFTYAAPLWGASHVGMASVMWGALVVLSVVETLTSENPQAEKVKQWEPQSNPAVQ
jgi:heme A synthase